MDWDKLRVFHAVAEAGSFTHAGDTLNLSQSAVSRQISALEEALAGSAVPPPRTRPDPDRAGRGAEPHSARGVRQAGDDRGVADRKQGKPGRQAEGHHHDGLRLDVAGAAAGRIPGDVSGSLDDAAARRQRSRSGDAGSRCRDPHASAQAAGSGAAPSDDAGVGGVRHPRLPEEARRAAARRGPRRAPSRPVRRLSPAGSRHQLAGRGRPPARQPAPRVAGGEQRAGDGAGDPLRPWHRRAAGLRDVRPTRIS